MAKIIVTVEESGDVKVSAEGIVGTGCKALTAAIERAIGTVTGDVKKPEFVQQVKQTKQQGA